jgi:hypothetical protein
MQSVTEDEHVDVSPPGDDLLSSRICDATLKMLLFYIDLNRIIFTCIDSILF